MIKYECCTKDTFGKNVRKYRRVRKITQQDLADLSGYHRTYVCALERGHANPTLDVILRVAMVLQVNVGYLLE